MFAKTKKVTLLFVFLTGFTFTAVHAQTAAQERSQILHAQLVEVQSKQTDLQSRLDELNEQLKPENIEKSLAGVGSTKPEDLRETRRRQLEIEKSGIEKQLAILNDGRMKLESSIAQADALTYQHSALPASSITPAGGSRDSNVRPRHTAKKKVRARRTKS